MAHKEIRTLFKMGDSLGITLPHSWLVFNNAKSGDKIEIITYDVKAEIKLLNNNSEKNPVPSVVS